MKILPEITQKCPGLRNGDRTEIFAAVIDYPEMGIVKGKTYLKTCIHNGFTLEEVAPDGIEDLPNGDLRCTYKTLGDWKKTITFVVSNK